MKYFLIIAAVFSLFSCKDGMDTPEGALTEFVLKRFSGANSKDFFLDRTTGKYNVQISQMTEENFSIFSKISGINKNSFKITNNSCQTDKCYLTYTLSYSQKNGKHSSSTDVKKIAELLNEEGKWKIADVAHVKTFHEMNDEINPLLDSKKE